jgi:hypothetical protein
MILGLLDRNRPNEKDNPKENLCKENSAFALSEAHEFQIHWVTTKKGFRHPRR